MDEGTREQENREELELDHPTSDMNAGHGSNTEAEKDTEVFYEEEEGDD